MQEIINSNNNNSKCKIAIFRHFRMNSIWGIGINSSISRRWMKMSMGRKRVNCLIILQMRIWKKCFRVDHNRCCRHNRIINKIIRVKVRMNHLIVHLLRDLGSLKEDHHWMTMMTMMMMMINQVIKTHLNMRVNLWFNNNSKIDRDPYKCTGEPQIMVVFTSLIQIGLYLDQALTIEI